MTNERLEQLLADQGAERIGAKLGVVSSCSFLGYEMFADLKLETPPQWGVTGAPIELGNKKPRVRLLGIVRVVWSYLYNSLALEVYDTDGERIEDPDGFRFDNTARSYRMALRWIWIRWEIEP